MNHYIKKQNDIRTEITDLVNCHSVLRDHYMQSGNQDLLDAMEKVLNRILAAERELDIVAEQEVLSAEIPRISIKAAKLFKI